MGDIEKEIQKLIDAHPESVHLLFKAKGIKAPVTPQNLINAFIVYGDDVIRPLVEAELKQSNYDAATTTTTADNTSTWEKIANLIMSGAVLTNQVNQVINPGKVQPLQTTQQTQQQATDPAAIEAYKKAEADKNAKTLLYIAIAVILVIIIAIIIVKRSKS